MKMLLKILLALVAAVLFMVVAVGFCAYSGDLPQVKGVAKYAPVLTTMVDDECRHTQSIAISYDQLGSNLQHAIVAAEAKDPAKASRLFALQISRGSYCVDSHKRSRELSELRASVQIRMRYKPEQLLTIYANIASFGAELRGVEAASQHFYGRHTYELDLAQAAMIAGMIKRASHYSPELHPEYAKDRRDQVLDAMATQGVITTAQAVAAKAEAVQPPHEK